MANNITIRDGNNIPITIRTWEESTSVHNNASIPINVSGVPIFTTAAPGIVCVAGSISIAPQTILVHVCNQAPGGTGGGDVSVSPTQGSIPVSVVPPTYNIPVSIAGTVNVSLGTQTNPIAVSVQGGFLNSILAVSIGGGSANIGTVSISPTQANIPVSLAPPTFNVPVSIVPNGNLPVSVAGLVNVSISPTQGVIPVSVNGFAKVHVCNAFTVSIADKVSVAGTVILGAGTALAGAVSVRQIVSVVPDGTGPNFPVSLAPLTFNVPVSIVPNGNLPVSVAGVVNVSINSPGTPLTVSVSPAGAPIAVSVVSGVVSVDGVVTVGAISNTGAAVPDGAHFVGGTDGTNLRGLLTDTTGAIVITSIKDDVSIADQTIKVHVCNALPAAGATQVVSIGAPVSDQAVQIAVRDTGGEARQPLANTTGNLLVHVCNSLPAATISKELVLIGAAVSDQAYPVAGSDGTNARLFLTDTAGAIVVTSIKDDVSIAPQTLITHVSNVVHVSVMDKVSVAGTVNAAQSGTWTVQPGNTANTTAWLVSVNGQVSLAAGVDKRVIGAVSVADATLAATQSGTWTVQPGNTANTTPWLVSVNGQVSLAAGVDKRVIGAVSVADATLAATQSGTWTVQPGNTANTTPWLVSVGGNVSLTDNAPVSVRGGVLGAVSLGGGTAQVGRVSVFVDQVPFNVSINNTLPITVSLQTGAVSVDGVVTVGAISNTGAAVPAGAHFVGGTDGTNLRGLLTDTTGALAITSIKDDVSLAPQTLIVHVCNAAPGGSGGGSYVSIGAPVSDQAIQIAVRDTGGEARTPLSNITGNLLVHVCNSLPTPPAADATQLVSIGFPVSNQAVQIAFTDGTDARTPLTNTTGNILVHVCNAAPGAAGGSSITVLVGGAVSTQAVPIAGSDGTDVRRILTDVMGATKVGGFTVNPEYVFTRPADTTAYGIGDLCGNSTTAGSVVPLSFPVSRLTNGGGSIMIRRARLITATDNRSTDRSYRLHIFNAASGVSVANGDNGVFSPSPVSAYAGYIDIPMHLSATTGAAGVGTPGGGSDINLQLATSQVSISALLEVRTSIAPANAATYRVFLEIFQD